MTIFSQKSNPAASKFVTVSPAANQREHVLQRRGRLRVCRGKFELAAERADHRVQQEHGRRGSCAGRGCGSDAWRNGNCVIRGCDHLRDAIEGGTLDASRRHSLVDVRADESRVRNPGALLRRNRLREGQCKNAFAARRCRYPVVRIRRSEVLTRADRDESRSAVLMRRDIATLRELAGVFGRRGTRVQEVGTEIHDQIRARDVEDR